MQQEQPPQQRRTVAQLQLTEEEFEAWKTAPTTRKIRQYLRDAAGAVRREWSQGKRWDADAKRYVDVLEDYADLSFESMLIFYGDPDAEAAEEMAGVLEGVYGQQREDDDDDEEEDE